MLRKAFPLLPCVFSLFLFSSALAREVIVDNSDAPCTGTGVWNATTSSCYGANKYTHGPGNGSDKFTWQTTLPAGWYVIYFRMNSSTTYTTEAQYSITHRDGTDQLTLSQRKTSSNWYMLGGAYYFDGTARVELSDDYSSATGSLLVADAIRFWSAYSFVQLSDSHTGYGPGTTQATAVANELKTLGSVPMGTYGLSAPPPSFGIHCGDATEYGQEYWSTFQSVFSGLPFPLYPVLGNHDVTQNCNREKIRSLYGSPYYSFEYTCQDNKYKFFMMNSGIIQTPRAGFAREELDWLNSQLGAAEPNTPFFLCFHHPIDGTSDPKPYDTWRLLETLRPYRSLMAFYGHGHSLNTTTVDGLRIVQGGSTYDDTTHVGDYHIITVTHGRVFVAKKVCGEPTAASNTVNYVIPSAPAYPEVAVASPGKDSVQTASSLSVNASISGASGAVTAVDFELDGDANWRAMTGTGTGPYAGSVSLSSAVHGRHWIRVRFTMSSGGPWYKMTPFWFWDGFPKARWVFDLGASSLCQPAIANGKVYVGANGGAFRCLDARYGAEVWKTNLPSDIISSPAAVEGKVIVGCGRRQGLLPRCLDGVHPLVQDMQRPHLFISNG